jgi:radical SAM superfamily enzyme YgiQ (UPF0313 family)
LLVSTYDLGRQPFGLASPAAWLRQAGIAVDCVDTSRDPLDDERVGRADVVGIYLPMHTATRLAARVIEQVRQTNPRAMLVAFGLYAPLNDAWLRERGVTHVLGPEAEGDLLAICTAGSGDGVAGSRNPALRAAGTQPASVARGLQAPRSGLRARRARPKLAFIQPDRSTLPPLDRYAALQMPDGTRRIVGSTESTRGCKHLCRHCPIVPVYRGVFRAIPLDIVFADIRAQVASGARHISFGDADFLNGPTHARRLISRFAAEFPGLTYDVTIKIEHLLKHADLLPLLRQTGCVFVTSAVESVDDEVLARLRKGHTRGDVVRAVDLCRASGVMLSPTFVPFTPWTTPEGYLELLQQIEALALVDAVAPIQLAIRLLVTAESALLELADLRNLLEPFDGASLTWPWRHPDPRVDLLQRDVMSLVDTMRGASRSAVFEAISALARERAGKRAPAPAAAQRRDRVTIAVPYLTEAWYCCAEPASAPSSASPEHDTGCIFTIHEKVHPVS